MSTPQLALWVRAARPRTLTAAIIPVVVGAALALSSGLLLNWSILIFGLISALFIQTGTNLINDAFDDKKGADNAGRLGPIRLIQGGVLSARQVYMLGMASFALAILFGIPLILQGGWPIALLFILSCLCGYLYTGGPYPLAYYGYSEIAVILFFGIIETAAVYYLLTGALNGESILAGVQIGLLATVMLTINNLRDREGDSLVGKRTLAVRYGVAFARYETAFCLLAPFAMGMGWIYYDYPLAAAMPLALLPTAIRLVKDIYSTEPSARYNQFLGRGALVHLLFGVALAFGFAARIY